jgi:sensor histidine kinase YesM
LAGLSEFSFLNQIGELHLLHKTFNFITMKSTIAILFLFVFAKFCLATEEVILPEEPWRTIAFMEKGIPVHRWQGNVSVKLFGNYTSSDSTMIEHSIKTLNELCETIKLSLTNRDRGDFEILFLDSTNEKAYESVIMIQPNLNSNWMYTVNTFYISQKESFNTPLHLNLAIRKAMIPEIERQNFFTNRLAFALYPGFIDPAYEYKNGLQIYKQPNSIFASMKVDGKDPFLSELTPSDRTIIEAVYKTNFTELLSIAKKQFDTEGYPKWLKENSYLLLSFPFALALLFLNGLIILMLKKTEKRIKNRFLRFNVISVVALLLLGIIGSFYLEANSLLKNPYIGHFTVNEFFRSRNSLKIINALFIIGLPALNILRLIEIAIDRKTKHIYLRILFVFISTSLIPSGTLLSIALFVTHGKLGLDEVKFFSVVFLVFVMLGKIRALFSYFIFKEKELKIENEVKLANLRELKTKAELNALHSKINPHFLYNALNSIAGLARNNAEKTEHMALSLSKLFRYSINKEQDDWSNFAEEMEMVRIYLDIEKVRFDDRLDFTIHLPEDMKTVKIPRFIIQPLVENAIKHGTSKLVGKGMVVASASRNGNWIEIKVADNGPDFPAELAPGFGLQSIYDKLEILYPNRFELHFVNSPEKHILIKLAEQ